MEKRFEDELELLGKHYPDFNHYENGKQWILIPEYELPEGWDQNQTKVSFQIKNGYPGAAPYGIYIPEGLKYKGQEPDNLKKSPSPQPPFEGDWWMLSWQPQEWFPKGNIVEGSNLLNWVNGFSDRFDEGV